VVLLPLLEAQEMPIHTARSTITNTCRQSGPAFGRGSRALGERTIASGTFQESGAPHVEFKVESAKMAERPDPKVDAKTQATIQKDMEEMTLQTKQYPKISFQSSRVEPSGADQWKVQGNLSLHGVTKPVSVAVKRSGSVYTGHTVLKQTDFGIKPISIGGGMVKIKNEIEIDFQIYPQ
jgi:hypothetical protein